MRRPEDFTDEEAVQEGALTLDRDLGALEEASQIFLRAPEETGTMVPFRRPAIVGPFDEPEDLIATYAAGHPDHFPDKQALPAHWFPGCDVVLHFSREAGGTFTKQTGSPGSLVLQCWSSQGGPVGAMIVLPPDEWVALPVGDPSELSELEITTIDDVDREA